MLHACMITPSALACWDQCYNPRQPLCVLHHDKPHGRSELSIAITLTLLLSLVTSKQAEEIMKKIEKEEVIKFCCYWSSSINFFETTSPPPPPVGRPGL